MLKLGDRVKIKFTKTKGEVEPVRNAETGEPLPWKFGGEDMWVTVTGQNDINYTGRLTSRPMVVDYKFNDKITFYEDQVLVRRSPSLKSKLVYNFIDWFNPHWSR